MLKRFWSMVVFGKNKETQVVPLCAGTHALANPVDEIANARIGLAAPADIPAPRIADSAAPNEASQA